MARLGEKEIERIAAGKIMRMVVAVRQSPLNPAQWCCDLDCGHDVWVSAKRRPMKKIIACDRCTQAAG
jgi:hypothetical protein